MVSFAQTSPPPFIFQFSFILPLRKCRFWDSLTPENFQILGLVWIFSVTAQYKLKPLNTNNAICRCMQLHAGSRNEPFLLGGRKRREGGILLTYQCVSNEINFKFLTSWLYFKFEVTRKMELWHWFVSWWTWTCMKWYEVWNSYNSIISINLLVFYHKIMLFSNWLRYSLSILDLLMFSDWLWYSLFILLQIVIRCYQQNDGHFLAFEHVVDLYWFPVVDLGFALVNYYESKFTAEFSLFWLV